MNTEESYTADLNKLIADLAIAMGTDIRAAAKILRELKEDETIQFTHHGAPIEVDVEIIEDLK